MMCDNRAYAALVVFAALLFAAPARADSTVTVSSSCTLPDAVAYANGGAAAGCSTGTATGTTTIKVPAGSYTLTSPLELSAPAIIAGAGAAQTTISGGGAVQVLINTSTLMVSDVTLTDGATSDSKDGCSVNGGILSCPAESGIDGGAVSNSGTLELEDDVVSNSKTAAGVGPTELVVCSPGCEGADQGSGGNGGGIANSGTLTVTGSTITGNATGAGGNATSGSGVTASGAGEQGGAGGGGGLGGGIFNDLDGTLTVSGSTISGNHVGAGGDAGGGSAATVSGQVGGNAGVAGDGGSGGGIFSYGTLTVSDSTISGNGTGIGGSGAGSGDGAGGAASGQSQPGGSGGGGGAIDEYEGPSASVTNVTMTGNTAAAGGTSGGSEAGAGTGGAGGAVFDKFTQLTLAFATIAGNTAASDAGALVVDAVPGIERNSIIASNGSAGLPECNQALTNDGGNIDFGDPSPGSCGGTDANPNLEPLASNGGPAETIALGAGSAAIGLVPLSACSQTTDERGIARPQAGACDAGAYEFAPPAVTAAHGAAASATTASVSAQIDPELSSHDTTVSVRYGTTSAFGSSTTPKDIGDGDSPVPFSATVKGLRGGTRYHLELVATNGDGTTNESLGTVRTPAYPRISAHVLFTFKFSSHSTTVKELKVERVPAGAAVEVICRGGGCPFKHRAFKVRHGGANATAAFKGHRLKPRATVRVQVTASGDAGFVETFTIRSDSAPRIATACLPPGARRPAACA
jgi:hypothetical protein